MSARWRAGKHARKIAGAETERREKKKGAGAAAAGEKTQPAVGRAGRPPREARRPDGSPRKMRDSRTCGPEELEEEENAGRKTPPLRGARLSLIHISEPTRPRLISYAVFCLKKTKE